MPAYSYSRSGVTQVGAAQGDRVRLAEAVQTLHEALRMDPKDPLALFGMAWALQLSGFSAEAREYYGKALAELNDLTKFVHYNLTFILERQGDKASALREVNEALRLAPDFEPARQRKADLERSVNDSAKQPGRGTD